MATRDNASDQSQARAKRLLSLTSKALQAARRRKPDALKLLKKEFDREAILPS